MRQRAVFGIGWQVVTRALVLLAVLAAAPATRAVDLIGYVPRYRMNSNYVDNILPDQLEMLDEVRYFGLTANSSGAIVPLPEDPPFTLQTHLNNIAAIQSKINAMPEAERPRLGITLGGAGQAASFSTIAASATLRNTFAQNISSLLNQTGATGVDIDWEHPDPARNNFNEIAVNYRSLLERIKQVVGSERRVFATVDPIKMLPAATFTGPNGIDGASIMTYELAWWAGDPAEPSRGEHSLHQYVIDSVNGWTEGPGSTNDRPWVFAPWGNNTPEAVIGIGMPFFGRGIGTSQQPAAGAAYTYVDLVDGGWSTIDGNEFTRPGEKVWIPGLDLVEQRVEFANERGLQHIIIWELGQDLPPDHQDSLLRRAFETNQRFLPVPGDYDGNGVVGAEDYDLWKSTFGLTSGDMRADGNEDGVVNADDYTFWRDRLTASIGSGSTLNAAVPEPSTAGLLILSGLWILERRVRGKRWSA